MTKTEIFAKIAWFKREISKLEQELEKINEKRKNARKFKK